MCSRVSENLKLTKERPRTVHTSGTLYRPRTSSSKGQLETKAIALPSNEGQKGDEVVRVHHEKLPAQHVIFSSMLTDSAGVRSTAARVRGALIVL